MEAMLAFAVFAVVAAIPITAILTAHQRKMVELLHRQGLAGSEPDSVARLAHEVAELRQLMTQQAIVLDDLSSMHRRLLDRASAEDSVRQRLGG
jgi:hypothetical protein